MVLVTVILILVECYFQSNIPTVGATGEAISIAGKFYPTVLVLWSMWLVIIAATGEIHEARIVLPKGFIFKKGDTLNTKECIVNDGPISFSYPGKNGHYAVVRYSGP